MPPRPRIGLSTTEEDAWFEKEVASEETAEVELKTADRRRLFLVLSGTSLVAALVLISALLAVSPRASAEGPQPLAAAIAAPPLAPASRPAGAPTAAAPQTNPQVMPPVAAATPQAPVAKPAAEPIAKPLAKPVVKASRPVKDVRLPTKRATLAPKSANARVKPLGKPAPAHRGSHFGH